MQKESCDDNKTKYLSKNPLIKLVMSKFVKDVTKMTFLCQPNKILDVGCGDGFITITISKKNPQSKITAIDIDRDYIDYAKKNNQNYKIKYRKGDLFKEKFKEKFDLVICNETLEHLENYEEALKKLISFSSKYVLISVPNEPWFRLANLLRLKNVRDFGNDVGHVNNWNKKQFKKLLSKQGKILRMKTSLFWNIVIIKKFSA